MEFNSYQRAAHDTAEGYADVLNEDIDDEVKALFLITALNGEVGEVSEKVKKGVRESEHPLEEGGYFAEAEDEIGDILCLMCGLMMWHSRISTSLKVVTSVVYCSEMVMKDD